ncbi:MAG: hypothetical protein AB7P47_22140, partial [Nocardioides sp.]
APHQPAFGQGVTPKGPATRHAHLTAMTTGSAIDLRLWCRKELGHVLLHGPDNEDAAMHRGIAEVEAESVALMIGAAHGLDTATYTIPYVTSWASSVPDKSPVEVVQATAERVRKTAVSILNQLETPQVGNGDPPGLDRTAPVAVAVVGHRPSSVEASERAQAAVIGL